MTDPSSLSIDDVRALVAERARFDGWLAALEARRAETPGHVYSRVHGDYTARRAQVQARLQEHAPVLAELLTGLDARVGELAATMGAHEDERAEAMLRHAVGEFDDPTWDEVRSRVEAELETLRTEREALDSHRDEVRGLLAEAQLPVAPAAEAAVVSVDREPAADDVLEAESEAAPDAESAPAASDERSADAAVAEDRAVSREVAALEPADESVTSDDVAPTRVPSITETLAAIEADVVDDVLPADDVIRPPRSAGMDRSTIWGSRAPGLPDAADGDASETGDVYGTTATSGGAGLPDGPAGGTAPASTSDQDMFDDLAFLRSVIDEKGAGPSMPSAPGTGTPQKTLRCTECGTMNLPTEWYCERCGGELASF